MMEQIPDWQGPNPWYLMIQVDNERTIIDLDQTGWATTYAELMRVPAMWVLVHKNQQAAPLMLVVHEGEQPYYTARHVGVTGSGGGNEVTAYGIGKKLPDGSVQRMWVMPNGIVCSGDDVDVIGIRMVHALGPR
jgi:hypothetical protein